MAGTITALRLQKKNKERVNVFLDDEYAFALSVTDAAGLRKGQLLSDADIGELRAAGDLHKVYSQALRYLGYRPRSSSELRRYLQGKTPEAATVDAVLARLEREQLVDDAAFARFWIEDRSRFRPRSARALRHELRRKGLAPDVIDQALADLDEEAAAWDAAAKKLSSWRHLDQDAFDRKLLGHLSRRGFSYGIARSTCERAWAALHDEDSPDHSDLF